MQNGKKMASPEDLKGKKNGGSGKKNGKSFLIRGLILLLGLGLAAGVYLISGRVQPPAEKTPAVTSAPDERVRLIDRPLEEVAEVCVERGGTSYTVVPARAGGADQPSRHTLKERPEFDLDQSKAEALLSCAAHLTATRQVAENPEDLSAYGLEQPVARVIMRYTDGTEIRWRIGDRAPTSTASYFMREGEKAVYLLYASAAESLSHERNAMHTLNMPGPLDAGRIRNVLLERAEGDPVEIGYSEEGSADRNYSISRMRLRRPFYYTANAERGTQFFQNIAALDITGFAGLPDELKDTGLEGGNFRFRLTVTQAKDAENPADGETFVFRVGNRTEDGESVYIAVDDGPAVYLTGAGRVNFLGEATPAYLVDQFANLIYIQAVRSIELKAGAERWLLEIEHGADEKTPDVFRVNGKTVADASDFRRLYQRIIGLTSSKLSEDYFLDGEVLLSVRYTLESDPGELLVEYLDYDADYCAVRRDGLTLFLLKKEQLDALMEALRSY
ncbi:MAG: DUF4340 domain-containing protein [Clostridiales bacterium]|nr:DUF4340 domain-containing protein [Clostridiales bacterium]